MPDPTAGTDRHLVARLSVEDQQRLELGRLLQSVFGPAEATLHVAYNPATEDVEDVDCQFVASVLSRGCHRPAMRGSLLEVLRAVAPAGAVDVRQCSVCHTPKPITEFRRRGLRGQGTWHPDCRLCRREANAARGGRAGGARV